LINADSVFDRRPLPEGRGATSDCGGDWDAGSEAGGDGLRARCGPMSGNGGGPVCSGLMVGDGCGVSFAHGALLLGERRQE